MATCRIHEIDEKYRFIECSRETWDQDPEGLCLLHSRQADKDKDGAFTNAVRNKLKSEDYDFRGVFFPGIFVLEELTGQEKFTFAKKADFKWATFQKRAYFFKATFQERAAFSGATFQERADFADATFQEATLSGATFQKWAAFSGATFQEADFFRATFQHADFAGATFQEADFFRATFQHADFAGATFQGKAQFVEINPQEFGEPPPPFFMGYFPDITLDREASLVFQDCSLSRVGFSGTDLRTLIFRNVDWHPYHTLAAELFIKSLPVRWQKWFRGRQAVYDEILLREKTWKYWDLFLKYGLKVARQDPNKVQVEDFARVEELYRGLKLNYGEAGDFKRVGDFHYGEMEMHRLASPWGWLPVYWYNLYKFLSGYGERPLLASILLLVFLFGLTGLACSWGLEFNPRIASPTTPASYWDALVFIFEKATFQRPDWLVPQNLVSRVFAGLSVLLIPGQAALFILALRNRLGRRR